MSGPTTDLQRETMVLQMGPVHPAMHGAAKVDLEIRGERVLAAEVEVGYLHRGFEKTAENIQYNQVIPYTDRLNYVSPIVNNIGFALAVEKLMQLEVPERAQWLRTLMSEISRVTDHLTCLGAAGMELGAFSVMLYAIEAREWLWELIDDVTGARCTTAYGRVGGLPKDLPAGFDAKCRTMFERVRQLSREVADLLVNNRIFTDRLRGTGTMSPDRLIAYGITGPVLRAGGVAYDVRKAFPYLVYDRLDWKVPIGEASDNYDRFMVRLLEMEQSLVMCEQVLEGLPAGPVHVDDPAVFLPDKAQVYSTIESLIWHFEHVVKGLKPPAGEVYFPVEGGNGEVGFYLVSDGSGKPYRLHCRAPSFYALAALPEMIIGHLVADIIPTFGLLNIIFGELDR